MCKQACVVAAPLHLCAVCVCELESICVQSNVDARVCRVCACACAPCPLDCAASPAPILTRSKSHSVSFVRYRALVCANPWDRRGNCTTPAIAHKKAARGLNCWFPPHAHTHKTRVHTNAEVWVHKRHIERLGVARRFRTRPDVRHPERQERQEEQSQIDQQHHEREGLNYSFVRCAPVCLICERWRCA